jgi:hypothetical protein
VALVLLVAVLAVSAALLMGAAGLAQVRLRAVRLLVAAAVVQVGTSTLAPGSGVARSTALVLTTVLVGLFVYGNWRVAGTPLIVIGLLLNVVVVTLNGAMPVSVGAAERAGLTRGDLGLAQDAMREPQTGSTLLGWLGDVVPVALPWWPQVVSPGDVLVAAGVGLLLVSARGDQRRRRVVPVEEAQIARRANRPDALASESTTTGSYS